MAWDNDVPLDATVIDVGAAEIRANWKAIENGEVPFDFIALLTQGTAPTVAANYGAVYTKDVSTKAELHWKDESGNVIQITTAGLLDASKVTAKSGTGLTITAASGQNITIKMGDAAGAKKISFTDSADVEVASLNSDGDLSITDLTASNISTLIDADQAIKTWVSYNGDTTTINASKGVDSVTRNGAGIYTVNFTAGKLTTTTYCVLGVASQDPGVASGTFTRVDSETKTTAACKVRSVLLNGNSSDVPELYAAFME